MKKIDYTQEEKEAINNAYFQLERITESHINAERCLQSSYNFEKRNRQDEYNTKVLIVREVYYYNKIKKENLFTLSEGIAACVVMACCIFHRRNTDSSIKKFKILAKLAIDAHEQYMKRLFNAHSIK